MWLLPVCFKETWGQWKEGQKTSAEKVSTSFQYLQSLHSELHGDNDFARCSTSPGHHSSRRQILTCSKNMLCSREASMGGEGTKNLIAGTNLELCPFPICPSVPALRLDKSIYQPLCSQRSHQQRTPGSSPRTSCLENICSLSSETDRPQAPVYVTGFL